MSVNNNYPYLQANVQQSDNFLKKIVLVVNNLVNGKTNNIGEVTLNPSATSTVVSNNLVNPNSMILLEALTANAASHVTHVYVVAGDKNFTIFHNSSPQTDRTHKYVIIG